MGALPNRGRPRGLFAVALLIFFGLTAPASAVITTSEITTPSDPTFLYYDDNAGAPPQVFTVSGTTDGVGGDLVDIACYNGGGSFDLKSNVAVDADGDFTTEVDKTSDVTCRLRAVPSAGFSNSLHNYSGPRVGFGWYEEYDDGVVTTNYYTQTSTLSAYNYFYSLGYFGICGSALYDAGFEYLDGNWGCVGGLWDNNFFAPGGDVRVDGHNAYAPATVDWGINGASVPGKAELGLEQTFDPLTGMWTMVETNPLVFCSSGGGVIVDVDNPGPADCPEFVSSGVTIVRTVTMAHDGRQVRFSDDWTSTDGAAHQVTVMYENYLYDYTTKWPGETAYGDHPDGTELSLGSFPVGTMYTQTDDDNAPGVENVQGAMTWLTAPTRAVFNSGGAFLLQFDRSVPANGSTNVTQVFSEAFSREAVQEMAGSVEDATAAPAVGISSPANGAVVGSDEVTVIGTATDNVGVQSLTVNGIPTPVNDDGSWSQRVSLAPGANTITAIATDASGNTGQAQTAVTYSPPDAPSCTVPNVVGQTQAAASAALTGAGCSVGALTLAPSRTIAKGSVVRQGNPAGQRVSAFYPVPLVISSGQVGQASLASRTLRLKGRRISMQVRCPSTAGEACNGTIKLRTNRLRGAKRTLGTKSFQAPPGGKRRTTLRVSKRNARWIHRAGRVRGLAFIVYRDEDGNARTTRTRILIRG